MLYFFYSFTYSLRVDRREIRHKLRSVVKKIKDNRKRIKLFSLDPRDSNGKSSGISNTIRSDGVFNKRDLGIAVDPAVRISAYAPSA